MMPPRENARLTQVGPGTPMGRLLRRYWHPIAHETDLEPQRPVKRIGILGEKLILFRTEGGSLGLVQESCPHRGASLYYGSLEHDGVRCSYHGWLFNCIGNCLDQPFELKSFKAKVKLQAYHVRQLGGLIFAYLGPPESQPGLPHWDILVRQDGTRCFETQPDLKCNWLQIQENAVDVTHTFYLHAELFRRVGIPDKSGFGRGMIQYGFQPFRWGIVKSWVYSGNDGEGWGNPLIFPNALRIETEMHWRVPIDDQTTRIFWVTFQPDATGSPRAAGSVVEQPPRQDPRGEYLLDTFMGQDAMAWESAGTVFDRSRENLGSSDVGIVMFRSMLKAGLRALEAQTRLPAQLNPEEEETMIDLRQWMGGYLPMSCLPDPTPVIRKPREQVFDNRHRVVRLPEPSEGAAASAGAHAG